MKRREILAAAIAASWASTGCGGGSNGDAQASSEPPQTSGPAPGPGPATAPPAPTPPVSSVPPAPAPSAPPTAPPPPPAVFERGPLPAWVPTVQGESVLVPMQNTLQSVAYLDARRLGNDSTFVFAAYSGGAFNPWYGAWGAHVIHGGGHAASQDNSVFIADFNTLRFERIGGPTLLENFGAYEEAIRFGGFPDDNTNPREVSPGVPGSAHTYDCLLILPPSICGDPNGALIRPVAGAIGVGVSRTTGWSHAFTFSDRRWARFSTNHAASWSPGGSCAYDSSRQKVWPISSDNLSALMSLDLNTRRWSNSPGFPRGVAGYPDMVYSAYCAHRDIVVVSTNREMERDARFYWFRADSNGSARTPVRFAVQQLPAANWGRGSLVYIPDTSTLVWFSLEGGDFFYEINVPSDPSQDWTWVARPITGPGRPSALTPPAYNSVYKRLDYSPQLKSLVWVTAQSTSASYEFGGRVVAIRIAP